MTNYNKKFKSILKKAKKNHSYWIERITLNFASSLHKIMEEKQVTGSELSRRIESSPAYITKVLRGDANYTVETMVKLAMALDSEVEIKIKPRTYDDEWQPIAGNVVPIRKRTLTVSSEIYSEKEYYKYG